MNTIFSVFDTVGRKAGGIKFFDISAFAVKVLTAVRVIFIVTFMLTAFQVGPTWLFYSDWFIITNMTIFAFSNGYASTLCAVKAPQAVEEEKRGQVGAFIGTCITFGIFVGSIIAACLTPAFNMTPGIVNKK